MSNANEQQSNQATQENEYQTAQHLRQLVIAKDAAPVYIIEKGSDYRPLLNGVTEYFVLDAIFEDIKQDKTYLTGTLKAPTPVIIRSNPSSYQAAEICKRLQSVNITVFRQDSNKPYKAITCGGLDAIRQEVVKQYQDNYSAGGTIAEFDNIIQSNANTPAIPTGFKRLDAILDGGLYEGLYTIGAISSLGKTTFCENIADHIAGRGQDVIIISLEMSKYELISKSISRLTFCKYLSDTKTFKYEWCKTARGITDGSRYPNYNAEEKQLIKYCRDYYAANIGNHLYIYEAIGDMNTDIMREIIHRHIDNTGSRPVVIIDYLQLLQHPDKYINGSDKQRTDANVSALKRLSRDFKIPVIAISSVNRMSYETEITFASFKESGGIEFSSDVVIGLQLAGVGKPDFNVNEAKARDPREIELVMLKNRQAKIGDKISFYYYPMFNNFMEIVEHE